MTDRETTFYKATNRHGRAFRDSMTEYRVGDVTTHPEVGLARANCPWTYLSVSTDPEGTLLGAHWPLRLFRVEAIGPVVSGLDASSMKRAVKAVRVLEELPRHLVFGPNGPAVEHLLETFRSADPEELVEADRALPQVRVVGGRPEWASLSDPVRSWVVQDTRSVEAERAYLAGSLLISAIGAVRDCALDLRIEIGTLGRALVCAGYPGIPDETRVSVDWVRERAEGLGPFFTRLLNPESNPS